MDIEESLQRYGIVPEKAVLPQIRALLAHETESERAGRPRCDDLALLCCVQLFSQGEVEDCLLIWEAKRSSFDLYSYLDVELMCGAGLEATKNYLETCVAPEAAAALAYIRERERSGCFLEFSTAGHLAYYRRYFGV